jgi:Domain of unknown function (DUF4410)
MKNTFCCLKRVVIASGLLALVFLGVGCASTAPKAKFSQSLAVEQQIRAKDTVETKVEASAGVDILAVEKQRIAERLLERIKAKQGATAARAVPQAYRVEVTLTRYDKGSAFARTMLVGLGQIHIDGEVKVFVAGQVAPVSAFTISKTFAWGGLYGGTTSIEDIERTFADGIAATLTGQAEDASKGSK